MKTNNIKVIHCLTMAVLLAACNPDDSEDNDEVSTQDATNISFGSATLNGTIDIPEGEIEFISFSLRTTLDGAALSEIIAVETVGNKGNFSAEAKCLIPNTTYTFNTYIELKSSEALYGESLEFTTSNVPTGEFLVTPNLGASNSALTINGPFQGYAVSDKGTSPLFIRFDFPTTTQLYTSSFDFLEPISEDRIVLTTPSTFVRDNSFSDSKANVMIEIAGQSFKIGEFQFTSSYYIEDESLITQPGGTIEVITNNALSDNVFQVNEVILTSTSFLIANGVHQNTLTIPEDFSAGEYQLIATSKTGNPLSVTYGRSILFTITEN